jgi:tetratricopeptide (TPR) repeat protein
LNSKFPGKSYLEKITQIFLEEGDSDTANALQQQAHALQSREMTDEESDTFQLNKTKVRQALSFGDLDKAIEFQTIALNVMEAAYGPQHLETLTNMCDLGECHMRQGALLQAREYFYRALRIASTEFGLVHPFAIRVKKSLRKCEEAERRASSMTYLEKQIDGLFRMSSAIPSLEALMRIERLEKIGDKLFCKGQMDRALKIYKEWLKLSLQGIPSEDESAIESVTKYANFLIACGDHKAAELHFKTIVQIRNGQNELGEVAIELKKALMDWAMCLSRMGYEISAFETEMLAETLI